MRIAHVVTYVSPDGAFGGPSRVALGQAAALAARGHEVTVHAAAPVNEIEESERDGFVLKAYPARRIGAGSGFAGMMAPALARISRRLAESTDVAHIHLARDLVTLPAALAFRRSRTPYVVQPHGMIDVSRRLLSKPLDLWATRPVLRDSQMVLVLTDREESDILEIEAGSRVRRIGNGVTTQDAPPYEGREKVVLFLARLHERKRPGTFVEMAQRVGALVPGVRFVIAGPDEGEGERLRQMVASSPMRDRIETLGAIDPSATSALFESAMVYVLPAINEVFPMTILEAFQAGTPVVTTDSLGIAEMCTEYGAAAITDGSVDALCAETVRLLTEDERPAELRLGAARLLREKMNVDQVAEVLDGFYRAAVDHWSDPSDPSRRRR